MSSLRYGSANRQAVILDPEDFDLSRPATHVHHRRYRAPHVQDD